MPISKKWKESDFWEWFLTVEEALHGMSYDSPELEDLVISISEALSKLSPDLEFEVNLEADKNGKKTFFISGAGVKESFPQVESLASHAPENDRWHFVKYKQRKEDVGELALGEGMLFSPDNIFYVLHEDDPGKVGLSLFFSKFQSNVEDIFQKVGFLFLDAMLGEYDVATRIGVIEFKAKTESGDLPIQPLSQLRDEFDSFFKQDPEKKLSKD